MDCVYQCPGLAIFGYSTKKDWVFLPIEFDIEAGNDVFFVDNEGCKIGEGQIEKILRKKNKTHIARCKIANLYNEASCQLANGRFAYSYSNSFLTFLISRFIETIVDEGVKFIHSWNEVANVTIRLRIIDRGEPGNNIIQKQFITAAHTACSNPLFIEPHAEKGAPVD